VVISESPSSSDFGGRSGASKKFHFSVDFSAKLKDEGGAEQAQGLPVGVLERHQRERRAYVGRTSGAPSTHDGARCAPKKQGPKHSSKNTPETAKAENESIQTVRREKQIRKKREIWRRLSNELHTIQHHCRET